MGAPKAGARPMTGKYRGYDPDGTTTNVADYFGNCSVCGALIDTRDLCMILVHLHGRRDKAPPLRSAKIPCTKDLAGETGGLLFVRRTDRKRSG